MAADESDIEYLKKELKAAGQAGFADTEWLESGKVPGQHLPAIRFPRQARFHPMKFLNGLIGALQRRGASLHEYIEVTGLDEDKAIVTATTSSGATIRARQVLVATNTPFHLRIPVHTKQAPYRTFAIVAPIPQGHAADVLLWDTTEPGYHYVRLQPGDGCDMLIVGGEDHKSGTTDDGNERIGRLEAWARERWSALGDVAYAWSGQVYEPADFIGFIGKSPQHTEVYLASGDSGQGMTSGGVAALLLSDLMNGRANGWTELYEPSRKMHHAVLEYLKENASLWQRIGTRPASFICALRFVRTRDAQCIGTALSDVGTVRATDRSSQSMATCSRDLPPSLSRPARKWKTTCNARMSPSEVTISSRHFNGARGSY